MKKIIMLSLLGLNLLTHASEQSSKADNERKRWIAEKKESLRLTKTFRNISIFGLGTSLFALGHHLFRKSPRTRSFPGYGGWGTFFFLQTTAMMLEMVDTEQLSLLKVEDPVKYKQTPVYYTDAPLYDGGRRVNEDGSYCNDEDNYQGW